MSSEEYKAAPLTPSRPPRSALRSAPDTSAAIEILPRNVRRREMLPFRIRENDTPPASAMEWVMDAARNPSARQRLQNSIAVLRAHDIKVINMAGVFGFGGQDQFLDPGQMTIVNPRIGPSRVVRPVQALQFHPQRGALDTVHPRIPAHHSIMILLCLPVIAEHLYLIPQFLVVRNNRARLPERSQVFARVKTEAAGDSQRTRLPAFVFGPMRLARVLDHFQPIASRNPD